MFEDGAGIAMVRLARVTARCRQDTGYSHAGAVATSDPAGAEIAMREEVQGAVVAQDVPEPGGR
jgi:hypothetical protein